MVTTREQGKRVKIEGRSRISNGVAQRDSLEERTGQKASAGNSENVVARKEMVCDMGRTTFIVQGRTEFVPLGTVKKEIQ